MTGLPIFGLQKMYVALHYIYDWPAYLWTSKYVDILQTEMKHILQTVTNRPALEKCSEHYQTWLYLTAGLATRQWQSVAD